MRRFIPFAIPSGTPSTVQTQTKSAEITTNGGSVKVQPDSGFLLSAATVTANIPTQSKTAKITTNGGSTTVTPDSGKLLTSVKVTANIPTEAKTQSITANGTYTITPASGKLMTKATVSVNVPTGEGLPAWIKEQSVTTFIPSSSTNEPLTVSLSGFTGEPEIVIVLTSLLSPTVTRSYGGGVYANRPNGINKRNDSDTFAGNGFIRQSSGDYANYPAAGGVTAYSTTSMTITPPSYSGSVGSWIAGTTYTIIALRTKTPPQEV